MTLQINTSAGARDLTTDEQAEARAGLAAASVAALDAVSATATAAQTAATNAAGVATAAQATATSAAAAATAAQAAAAAAYVKPTDGVPRQDLDHTIRGQLDLADTALQPGAQLTQAVANSTTAAGAALMTGADAAAQRTTLGLGTAATTASTTYATAAQGAKADAALPANAGAIADVLEAAATGAPADLARIQASVSGDRRPALLAGASNAAANASAINAALAQGGKVTLGGGGTYEINATLILESRTTLEISAGTTIKLADGSNCNPIATRNDYRQRTQDPTYRNYITSLTRSGVVVTMVIPDTNTEIPATGDYVSVWNTGAANYGGVFRVISKTKTAGSWTLVYQALRNPKLASPPGLAEGMRYCVAHRDIHITGGGALDCNIAGQGSALYKGQMLTTDLNPHGNGIVLAHVIDYSVGRELNIDNCGTRCIMLYQARNGRVSGKSFGTRVMLQTNGAIQGLDVVDIRADSLRDDGVAIMDTEGSGFVVGILGAGDIQDIRVNGVKCYGAGGLDSAGHPGKMLSLYAFSTLYDHDVQAVDVYGQQTGNAAVTTGGDIRTGNLLSPANNFNLAGVYVAMDIIKTGTDTWQASPSAEVNPAWIVNAQTGTAYTPVIGGAGKVITMSNAAAMTFTVPTNASVAYPVGTRLTVKCLGAGNVTVAAAGGVTVYGLASQIGAYSNVTIDGLKCTSNLGPQITYVNIGKLELRNMRMMTYTGAFGTGWVGLDASTKYKTLIVDGFDISSDDMAAGSGYGMDDSASTVSPSFATIKRGNCSVPGAGIYRKIAGTLQALTFDDCRGTNGGWIAALQSGVNIKDVFFNNCSVDGASVGVYINGNQNTITLNGPFSYNTGGFLQINSGLSHNVIVNGGFFDGTPILNVFSGSTVNLWLNGANTSTGIGTGGVVNVQAGGTLNPKTLEIRLDVSATGIGRVLGNKATHIGATNPGPAYCNGTNWLRMYDGAVIV